MMSAKIKKISWTDTERKYLKDLCAQVKSWPELKKKSAENKDKFKEGRTWNSIRSECNNHPSWRQHFRCADKNGTSSDDGNGFMAKLIDYLVSGKTIRQIAEKFKIKPEEAEKVLKNPPEGFRLSRQQNSFGEDSVVLLPEMTTPVKLKDKIWDYQRHESDPYLVIEFPNDLRWKKINIIPIADVFFGDIRHNEEMLDEYINWISRSPHVFVFLNGNIFKKFSKVEKDIVAVKTVELQTKLSRIAHKILWAQPGNNEENAGKMGFDPLQFVCEELKIPYFNEPVYADILWHDHIFTFFCIHGRSNALTKGGRLNAILRSVSFQEFIMFTVMAHIQDKMVNPVTKIRRNSKKFELEAKRQYLIICPSFVNYFGSEAARKGYSPNSMGTVSCRLYSDGRYWTSN